MKKVLSLLLHSQEGSVWQLLWEGDEQRPGAGDSRGVSMRSSCLWQVRGCQNNAEGDRTRGHIEGQCL